MGWYISNVENTLRISRYCAKELLETVCGYMDEAHGIENEDEGIAIVIDATGLIRLYDDWMEHMDFFVDPDALDVLKRHKANGMVTFASTDGDNRNTTWGYKFTDGAMEYDRQKLGKELFKPKKTASKSKAKDQSVDSNQEKEESIALFYKDGNSDKVYQAQLVKNPQIGYDVNFQYGRRGGTLAEGQKGVGLSFDKAKKAYDKVVAEKTAKGYQAQEGAPVSFVHADKEFSGELPQLLNEIFDDEVQKYIDSDDWFAQQKFDGHNRQMRCIDTSIQSINRKGFIVGMPQETSDALKAMNTKGNWHLAGELMGNIFAIFDVRMWEDQTTSDMALEERMEILEKVRASLPQSPLLAIADTAKTKAQKQVLFQAMKDGNYEGLVFKRKGSKYVPGRPASGGNAIKFRFLKNASFRVASQSDTKRSVHIEVLDANGQWIGKGKVSIPANYAIPAVGAVVDVKYVYAYKGGALAQPRYEGERDDVDAQECLESRLVFKRDDDEDSEE